MTRFIPFQYYDPYFKTGLNEALMDSVRDSKETVIFISGWEKDCVNIGYSQKIEQEINRKEVEKREIEIVRRQGGGGTTYLTRDGEITWGIIAPTKEFEQDVNKIYENICSKLARGLSSMGIEAKHEPINDIVTENGKISGATLKREDGVTYIGGTLIYKANVDEMFRILTPPKEKLDDKDIENFEQRITSVKKESDASFDQAVGAVKKGLLGDRKFSESSLTDEEIRKAESLADKYSEEKWLYRE